MGSVDRMSELPEFILHLILSFLDTKEACRVTVLSKYWYAAWSSTPVLDFRPLYSVDPTPWYEDWAGQRFIEYVDRTMRRYFEQKHRISKLFLEVQIVSKKIEHLVDKWIGIAVQNHVEELTLTIPYWILSYRLPEIIFSSKSLKVLNCVGVHLPYYETVDLNSLESLTLMLDGDTDMLQRIITFCPLIHLNITTGSLGEISIPWVEKGFETTRGFGGGSVQSDLKTSLLRSFVYCGNEVSALKNLSKVEMIDADITDDIVYDLASRLVALECLVLFSCRRLQCIQISSNSLKEFHIKNCLYVKKVTVDAPNLLEFGYGCDVKTYVSLIRVQDCCNAHFLPWMGSEYTKTFWFVRLKKFLLESNIFGLLVIDFPYKWSEITAHEDVLKCFSAWPPYKVRELKLRETDDWRCDESSLTALLGGLFWSCRPDMLSITTSFYNLTAQTVLNILKDKVQCWKHPLKSVEVQGANLSSLLTTAGNLEIGFRLSWKSF